VGVGESLALSATVAIQVTARRGHEFGLRLPVSDKAALMLFWDSISPVLRLPSVGGVDTTGMYRLNQ
jgi:hypothetical protein